MREPNKPTYLFNGGLVHTTERPALSLGTDDGQSIWVELTDEQVLRLAEDALYYLGRRARMLFRQQANGDR